MPHGWEKRGGIVEGADFDACDPVGVEAVRVDHLAEGVDGGMGPAADRVGFDVVFGDGPAGAEIGPEVLDVVIFDGDSGGTFEAVFGEKSLGG